MNKISLTKIQHDLPDHHRRWVRLAMALTAAGYLAATVTRFNTQKRFDAPELTMLLLSLGALLAESKFPKPAATSLVIGIWLELMSSYATNDFGVRGSNSVVLPVLLMGCAFLLGARAAWIAFFASIIAIPAVLLLGTVHLGGKGLVPGDLQHLLLLGMALFTTTLLLSVFLQTLTSVVERESSNAARWREFFEEAPDAIVAVDPSGKVMGFNRLAALYLGLHPQIVLGRSLAQLQELRPACFALNASGVSSLPSPITFKNRILELRVRETRNAWQSTDKFFIFRDVTDREKMEKKTDILRSQLNQVQKMEAIGQLAGGFAHDFNNLLTAISGAAFVLRDNRDAESREIAEELQDACRHGSTLTRQLLTFARREVVQATVIDLGEALHASKPLIRRVLGERIQLQLDCAEECKVRLDRGHLEQLVLNFAANAKDAISASGTFCLSVYPQGASVILRARDTGSGMTADTLEHIFEPFYTTKSSAHGTGLGLATVHGIVTQWKGKISVESTIDHGTEFIVEWPYSDEEITGISHFIPKNELRAQSGRVLLVEDNEPARRFLRRILDRAGYRVTVAASAEEALSLCKNSVEPDILISDVIMPGLTGVDLATRLHEKWTELPVLFVSGYVNDVLENWPYSTKKDLLLKPFTADVLLERVGDKLHQRTAKEKSAPHAQT